ncbi:MAG: adaptor protein MecA [Clostridia bacterium]|nr:adaptor protein MecA [Clostridia bacterium]
MTFTSFGEERLKISLDGREAKKFFGTTRYIDRKSRNTKVAIKLLLSIAVQNHRFKPSCTKLSVDIFKNMYGGLDIFFEALDNNIFDSEPFYYVIEFENCNNAAKASKILDINHIEILESRFFKTAKGYRMLVLSNKEIYDKIFSVNEFCIKIHRSFLEKVRTEEYGKEIITNDAIGVLKRFY